MKINTPKLYEQMSIKERAELAFKCFATHDQKTLNAIKSKIKRSHYTAYDIQYSE